MPFPSIALLSAKKRVEKHRLFIAFPVFLTLFSASLLSGMRAQVVAVPEPVDGTVLTVGQAPETVMLGGSVIARLLPGTILIRDEEAPVLSEGEGAFAAADCFSVSVGAYALRGCGGAFHVKRQGDDVAVSALTTPVLVQASGGTVLVSARRIWSAPARLHALGQGMPRWVTERTTAPMTSDALRTQLPVATDLLSDVPTPDAASLATFASTSTGWLIAAFHPDTRDLAWTLPQPETTTKEEHLLSLLQFLPADILPEAYSAVAFGRWNEALRAYLSYEPDVSVIAAIQEQAKSFSRDQMPERAERAANVLR